MRKVVIACAIVAGLLIPAGAASAWTPSPSGQSAAVASGTSGVSTQSVRLPRELDIVKFVSDRVALSKIELSPFTKRIFNAVLRAVGPSLCPALGALAAPEFSGLAIEFCRAIFAAPDPLGAAMQSLPLLCTGGLGETIFPRARAVLPILCGLLL